MSNARRFPLGRHLVADECMPTPAGGLSTNFPSTDAQSTDCVPNSVPGDTTDPLGNVIPLTARRYIPLQVTEAAEASSSSNQIRPSAARSYIPAMARSFRMKQDLISLDRTKKCTGGFEPTPAHLATTSCEADQEDNNSDYTSDEGVFLASRQVTVISVNGAPVIRMKKGLSPNDGVATRHREEHTADAAPEQVLRPTVFSPPTPLGADLRGRAERREAFRLEEDEVEQVAAKMARWMDRVGGHSLPAPDYSVAHSLSGNQFT